MVIRTCLLNFGSCFTLYDTICQLLGIFSEMGNQKEYISHLAKTNPLSSEILYNTQLLFSYLVYIDGTLKLPSKLFGLVQATCQVQ